MCSVLWSNFKQKKQQQQAQTTTTVATPVTQNDNYKTILAPKSGKSAKQNNVRTILIIYIFGESENCSVHPNLRVDKFLFKPELAS